MDRTGSRRARVEVYRPTARILHWVTVVLLAVQIPVGVYMTYRGGTLGIWDGVTGALYSTHKLLGVLILAVVLWRLAYRLARGAPADEPTLEPWQRLASHANHWGLYVLAIAAAAAGYVGVSLFPALEVFGLFSLPGVVAPDKEAAKTAFAVHALLVLVFVCLIALHVAAALYHHFLRGDDVLARMIPRLLRGPRSKD